MTDVPVSPHDARPATERRPADALRPDEVDALFPLVYEELRRLADARLGGPRHALTLSATGLVHEVYLKMAGRARWTDRAHFVAIAARAMRQVLASRARARGAVKRGGPARAVTLHDDLVGADVTLDDVYAVDAALVRLEAFDSRLARLVELRFYGGLEVDEAASVLGLSPRTAARDWARAKAHLRALLD